MIQKMDAVIVMTSLLVKNALAEISEVKTHGLCYIAVHYYIKTITFCYALSS